ncbi:MAG: type II secretion system protein GspF, partial [Bacillota bacterium]
MTPKFQYVAKNKAGDKIEGKIEADNSETVVKQLKERGYFVTTLKKKKEKTDVMEFLKFNK